MIFYAITDPTTLNFQTITSDLKRFADKKADMIVYRDKANQSFTEDAQRFLDTAKLYGFDKVLLHGDIALAKKLEADGVHLSASQFAKIKRAKKEGLFVIMSTHSMEEAQKAELLGADMITYSPIFETPGKGEPVGLDMLRTITAKMSIPVLALGGILTKEQIDACEVSGASGFASIRYFA